MGESMHTVDAIYENGVFRPLGNVPVSERQRVRLTIEPAERLAPTEWLDAARAFQHTLVARHGVLPDSTPEIAADRRRHE
jgi:predicted DNA-binding antitoxin AbrB/MazE fold protein